MVNFQMGHDAIQRCKFWFGIYAKGSLHLLSVLNNVESRTASRMWDLVSVGWRCNAERSTRWACWVEVQAWTSGAESWVACWMVLTITSPSYKISKRRKSWNWRQPTAWLQEQAHTRPASLRLSRSCQSLSRTSPSRRGLLLQSFNLQSHWTATSIMSSPKHHDRDSASMTSAQTSDRRLVERWNDVARACGEWASLRIVWRNTHELCTQLPSYLSL